MSLIGRKRCCEPCGTGPWISAYQIAVKYGFQGSEAEWIRSIGTMRAIYVTERSGGVFSCTASLGSIRQMLEDELIPVLITLEGMPAFLSGLTGEVLSFSTAIIRDTEGDYYDCYSFSGRERTVAKMTVAGSGEGGSVGPGSITYSLLNERLQEAITSAESAVQPEELFTIRGYATMAAYLEDSANVKVGDFVLVTEASGAKLYRKTIVESVPVLHLEYTFPAGSGSATWADIVPSGGVPYDDLTQQVQGYLDLAASAVQTSDLTLALSGLVRMDRQTAKTEDYTQRIAVDQNGVLWGQSSESSDDTNEFITTSASGSETIASKTSMEIYNLLESGQKDLILIDSAGRQSRLIVKPMSNAGGYTDAKFWTFDSYYSAILVYTINSSGVVTTSAIGVSQVPSGGWTKNDLDQGVQGSLELADTALQPGDVGLADLDSEVQEMLTVAGELVDVSEAVADAAAAQAAAETAQAAAEAAATAAQTGANVVTAQNMYKYGNLPNSDITGWGNQSGNAPTYDAEKAALKLTGATKFRPNGNTNGVNFNYQLVEGHHYYVAMDAYSDAAASITLNGTNTTGGENRQIPAETWTHIVFAGITAQSGVNSNTGIMWDVPANQIVWVKNLVCFDLDAILTGATYPASDLRKILNGQYASTVTIALDQYLQADASHIPTDIDIDALMPLPAGNYYNIESALRTYPRAWRRKSQTVRFKVSATQEMVLKYRSGTVTDSAWLNTENWEDLSVWPVSHGMASFTTSPKITNLGGIDFTQDEFFIEIVMRKYNGSAQNMIDFLSRNVTNQNSRNMLMISSSKLRYGGSGGNYILDINNSKLLDGWNHILMVRKSGNVYTYVNGKLEDTKTVAGSEFQYLEDISFVSGCPAVALVRVGTNADTSAAARFMQCSPITYDASSDGVVVEILPEDFHATMVRDRASGHIYECAITEGSASAYPDPIIGEGPPESTPQFQGQRYYDTLSGKEYFSTGMNSAINWDRVALASEVAEKQDILGPTNLKTINNISLMGYGNIEIGEGSGGGSGALVNVKDHGAYGDGIHDDTAAIQNARNIAKLIKGTIFFPSGIYLTRQAIIMEYCMGIDCDPGAILRNGSAYLDDDQGNPATGYCALTTTTAALAKGDHTVNVASTVGFSVGQQITIWKAKAGGYNDTHALITDITGNTITFDTSRWSANNTDDGAVEDLDMGAQVHTDHPLIETVPRDSRNIVIRNIEVQPCGNPNEAYCYTTSPIHQTSQKRGSSSKQENIRVIGVTVRGSVQDGISIQGRKDALVAFCNLIDIRMKGCHHGTELDNMLYLGNWFEGCGDSTYETTADANGGTGAIYWCSANSSLRVIGNNAKNCTKFCFGFDYRGQGEPDYDATIIGNTVADCSLACIETQGGYRMIVEGNTFRGFTGAVVPLKIVGFYANQGGVLTLSVPMRQPVIKGNTFAGFANGYTNLLGAIYLKGVEYAIIEGNNILPNTNATGSAKITLEECTVALVSGNICQDVDLTHSANVQCVEVNNMKLGVSA